MNMICSVCKKNPAVVFINKIENNKTTVEGLCYNCAKEKGINPLQVLSQNTNISDDDIEQISEQLGNFMDELSSNGSADELNENNPLAGIFNLFNKNNDNNAEAQVGGDGNSKKKAVKVEKKQKNNRKKFLDSFGTNLTALALERKIR